MKTTFKPALKFVVPSILVLLQACEKNPSIPEADPMFQEKKRPPYNDLLLNKTGSKADYRVVDPNFANDYQDTQREFMQNKNDGSFGAHTQTENTKPLTIQRIRDDSAQMNNTMNNGEFMAEYQEPEQIKPAAPKQNTAQTTRVYQSEPIQPQVTQSHNTATGDVFEIQAGSYNSKTGAMNVVQKLESHGINNVRIDDGGSRYTVRVTGEKPFTTREEASHYMQQIIEKTQHYDIMVVKK